MCENLLPSSEILRGASSISYFLNVKSDFEPFKNQTAVHTFYSSKLLRGKYIILVWFSGGNMRQKYSSL